MNETILSLSPQHWEDYELIDTGGFEKLERFGAFILSRPEPQAIWDKSMSDQEWKDLASAHFSKEKNNPEKGQWNEYKKIPHNWQIKYQNPDGLKMTLNLAMTSFKHIGLFPEQAVNWDYITDTLKKLPVKNPKVLNLFAYTGASSVAAKAAGAEVSHLDSVKQVVTWSKHNMESSGQDGIRWIVDDAMKFIKREVRRGNKYHGIILDPPAYGRGPEGEKWILEEQINEMLKLCAELLEPEHHFLILNMYSLSFSSLIAANLINSSFKEVNNAEHGELYLIDRFKKKLPLGIFFRFRKL
ncbi:oxidoreductase [Rhodonellum psychrophilum GCM71 = DSM 17998]|uniref:Oxidoreductase n=2 Tax=Rhodonellum TaxID=336827 RepID=U5BYT5_9BACT|nr:MULTISPECIES: class I SAM-dependent methyltransferase [Rhodonellum]ERM83008.1 oxidoreductase [Rhodonellum psychrophilum GCM71 = DSM 17998]MDO9553069.1 class I SAM-dependent methyltransferase [Rhodonellum sp.]SDZ35952.1 23S rRNA (cytosine1962-C5)-methyltransferase [Rhodonellum ikkaensis]